MTKAISNLAFVSQPNENKAFHIFGQETHDVINSAQSGGAYYCFVQFTPPGLGVPPHTHSREDEIVHVIEGELEFFIDGKLTVVGAGGSANFARGTMHGYQNTGKSTVKTFWVTPGLQFENFFKQLANFPAGPPDVARLNVLLDEYGMTMPPPA